jgi:hypothetical protein
MKVSFLGIIAIILFILWLILVLLNKGGFIHLLLLVSSGIAVVEIASLYRTQVTK